MRNNCEVLNGPETVIREATVEDIAVLLEFEQAIIDTERPFDPTIRTDSNVHYYDLEALIVSPDVEVLVAEIGSEIIGSGYARIDRAEPYLQHRVHSYLGFMFVLPEHRGKGINRMIVNELESWSRSRGVMEMRLEVYAENTAAIRAYEKSGYSGLVIEMRKALRVETQR
jgi:GNAT superfamily N-acetyltransferase